jgi:hypothetical protein
MRKRQAFDIASPADLFKIQRVKQLIRANHGLTNFFFGKIRKNFFLNMNSFVFVFLNFP